MSAKVSEVDYPRRNSSVAVRDSTGSLAIESKSITIFY
jgi:hypothetical protein